jgi:hypothetical protein
MRRVVASAIVLASCGMPTPAQGDGLPDGYRADVDRVTAHLERAASAARYGFTCTLERLSIEPAGTGTLREEFRHLGRFLAAEPPAPLVTCEGGVRGAAWYADVDDALLPEPRRVILHFDGVWSAQRDGQRAWLLPRYRDPGVGQAPWLWSCAGAESFAPLLRGARGQGLVVEELRPERPEDAGAHRLLAFGFQGPEGHGEYRLEAKLGPDGARVLRIQRLRDGELLSDLRLSEHDEVDGLLLPTRLAFGSVLTMQRAADGVAPRLTMHWRIQYREVLPDVPGFVAGLAEVDELVSAQRTLLPIAGIDRRIRAFVADVGGAEPADAQAESGGGMADAPWPRLAEWLEARHAAGAFVTLTDVRSRYAMHVAVAACAGLRGVDLSFADVLAATDEELSPEQAQGLLERHDVACTPVELEPKRWSALRDGFVFLRPDARHGIEVGVVREGRVIAWSLAAGARSVDPAANGPSVPLLVSRADAARLAR